jgi:hypothetical protein
LKQRKLKKKNELNFLKEKLKFKEKERYKLNEVALVYNIDLFYFILFYYILFYFILFFL